MVGPPAARNNEREVRSTRSVPACALYFLHQPADFAAPLVASCNFSRQYAELIDVPIANKHLDSGCHCLIAGVPLGLASSLPRSQMLEFEHGGCCISMVSHGPSPSQYIANFGAKHGGEWAPSRRNLGSLLSRSTARAAAPNMAVR
jgi:hypothetical protein